MMVKQVLQKKGNDVISVRPDNTVYEAIELMADKNIGAVLVMDGEELAGIFSERDYARKVILAEKKSKSTPVSEIMTSRVFCVSPQNTMDDCMSLMTDKRIRHLPVLEEDKVVGIISIGDAVKEVIAQQASKIEQLENYITTGFMAP